MLSDKCRNILLNPFRLLFFAALLISQGCGNKGTSESGLTEGVVEYEISYPNLSKDHPLSNLLPTSLKVYFKDNKTSTEMKSMGIMRTSFIGIPEDDEMYVLFRMFEDRLSSTLSGSDIRMLHQHMGEIQISMENDTKTIAGYKCKRATARFQNGSMDDAALYYTNEINVDNASWTLPYPTIPGFLMEYDMLQNDILMHFEAKKVLKTSVPDDVFEIPDDYKMVPLDVIQKKMADLSEAFQNF